MTGLSLVMAVALAASPADGGDPAALVQRLGAPRFADREAAAEAIEALGRDALPALRQARVAEDPEIRSRAAVLLERIEAVVMVRPTLVRLDFHDRPLAEVVQALSERAGMPLVLLPENNPQWQTRRITLESPEPVTFWSLMDRLAAGGFQSNVVVGGIPGAQGPRIQLYAGQSPAALPSSDSGPFRSTIHGIHYHRDLVFGGPPMPSVPFAQAAPPGQAGVTPRTATEQFYLDLQVVAEPRLAVAPSGPIRVVEAVDEKGHSLMPVTPAAEGGVRGATRFFGAGGGAMPSLQLQIPLRRPEDPGRIVKRLRGVLPVSVSARKEGPLQIDLAESKGKTFTTQDASLIIHEMKVQPDQPRTTIELSLRPNTPSQTGGPAFGAEMAGLRGPNFGMSQIEILDAQGRAFHQWFPSSTSVDTDELRMTVTLLQNEGLGPPAQLRFYDLARATAEVAFEFHDLPMP